MPVVLRATGGATVGGQVRFAERAVLGALLDAHAGSLSRSELATLLDDQVAADDAMTASRSTAWQRRWRPRVRVAARSASGSARGDLEPSRRSRAGARAPPRVRGGAAGQAATLGPPADWPARTTASIATSSLRKASQVAQLETAAMASHGCSALLGSIAMAGTAQQRRDEQRNLRAPLHPLSPMHAGHLRRRAAAS